MKVLNDSEAKHGEKNLWEAILAQKSHQSVSTLIADLWPAYRKFAVKYQAKPGKLNLISKCNSLSWFHQDQLGSSLNVKSALKIGRPTCILTIINSHKTNDF